MMANIHNDISGRIRAETGPVHQQLESCPSLKNLTSPGASPHNYRRYLQLAGSYHRLVESGSFPVLNNIIGDLEERKKSALLLLDLQTLGAAAPEVLEEPGAHSVPFHLGMLYVSEGSMLGGLVIMKNLSQVLEARQHSFNFLNCYGNQAALMWRKFTAQLSNFASGCTQDEQNEIVAGARHGFQLNLNLFS